MKLATLCYLRKNDQTLMIHRVKKRNDIHQGKWNGLGGKLEPGESPEDCVRREVEEESGLLVKKMWLKGFLSFPGFANDEDWYAFVFVIPDYEGQLIESAEGDLKWVDNSELLQLNLWEGDRVFLPWLDKPGIFSGKFAYKDGSLIEHSVSFYE
jgi:8-oxo-dGTP diphosphatase